MSPLLQSQILCAGGAHFDRLGRSYAAPVPGASNPGTITEQPGGVARNVAETLVRLGCPVALLSRVGADEAGRLLLETADDVGIDTSLVSVSETNPTGVFTGLHGSDGELLAAVADMEIYREITPSLIEGHLTRLRQLPFWFLDCNLPAAALDFFLSAAGQSTVCVGAVSPAKAQRLKPVMGRVDILFARLDAAATLAGLDPEARHDPLGVAGRLRDGGCRSGVVTVGREQIVLWSADHFSMMAVPAGMGSEDAATSREDGLAAGTIFGLVKGFALPAAVQWGLAAGSLPARSERDGKGGVGPSMRLGVLETRLRRVREG